MLLDHKGLISSNGGSIAGLSHKSNCFILDVRPKFDEPEYFMKYLQSLGFLLCFKVDPNMEGLISAGASKYNLRAISTIQRHSSNNEQLQLVVFAELDPLKLHHHGQLGAVHREL